MEAFELSESQNLGQRLLATYQDMPRAERRLADLLLEDVGIVRHFTSDELAGRAGVSKATATRLFRRVGYSGYRAVQREARENAVRPGQHRTAPQVAAAANTISAYLDAEIKHLVRTFEQLRSDDLNEAVKLLRDGQKLWVVGFGEDYPLAHFARSLLIKLRSDIRMIPIGGFPIPEEFASINADDTMLALGVGRRTENFRNIIGSAARKGTKVILVTDTLSAGDKSAASVVLRGRCSGPTLFSSMTASVSLLTYLCARLAIQIGPKAVDRLRVIESIHREWNDHEEI